MQFITAHLLSENPVELGHAYEISQDAADPHLRNKQVTVVAGPHADYMGPDVYTCTIDGTADILPFFNRRWSSCFESITLPVNGPIAG